jgi:hypothetical protein
MTIASIIARGFSLRPYCGAWAVYLGETAIMPAVTQRAALAQLERYVLA